MALTREKADEHTQQCTNTGTLLSGCYVGRWLAYIACWVLVVVKAMITNRLLFVQHAGQALVHNGPLCCFCEAI